MQKKTFVFLVICCSLLLFFLSCSQAVPDLPVSNPVKPVVPDTLVKGYAYMIVDLKLAKLNIETNSVTWQTPIYHGDNKNIDYDSGYLYHGNYSGIWCYNSVTGTRVWEMSWLSYSNVINFSKYAFNDSLVFAVSPTSAYDVSYLFCLNKRTGLLKWKNKIDTATWASGPFSTVPVISDNKIITVCRDNYGHKKLTAFNVSNGQKIWGTGINDALITTLKVNDGRVYSSGEYSYCYEAATGNLLWQANTQLPNRSSWSGLISFIDQTRLIVVGNTTVTSSTVKVFNKVTGNEIFTNTINRKLVNCMYANDVLYLISLDTNAYALYAYNINNMELKWSYKPFTYYPQVVTDKSIIFSGIDSSLSILNLDGTLRKRVRSLGSNFGSFTYVDSANRLHTQQW